MTAAIVLLGSDDGLCGAYNVNIFKQLLVRMSELRTQFGPDLRIVLYPVGAKLTKAAVKIAAAMCRWCRPRGSTQRVRPRL